MKLEKELSIQDVRAMLKILENDLREKECSGMFQDACQSASKMLDKLQEYENFNSQNRLCILPCDINKPVYLCLYNEVIEMKIEKVSLVNKDTIILHLKYIGNKECLQDWNMTIDNNAFNTIAFRSKKAAESYMKLGGGSS